MLVALVAAQALLNFNAGVIPAATSMSPQRLSGYDATPSDDWPTYHRDMFRSGYDPATPQLTSVAQHWKSTALDGSIYAEPLIVGTDVIVATEGNSIYELDAATGQILWQTNLGTPVDGGTLPCGDINPSGITGTPAIDVAARTIFAVAFLPAPSLHHQLFALDLDTGAIRFQLGIDPPGSNPTIEQQRAALALANGYVYVPYGGLDGDCEQYRGWLAATSTDGGGSVIGYQVATGRAGGIWGGGDGPAVDQSGNILVATGNSDSTSTFDYGDAVLKLSPASNPPISLIDWFAPPNWQQLNAQDLDLGSTEPVTLSPNDLFQIGKDGIGYLLNATKLGGIGGQLYSSQVCNGGGAFGGLAYSSPYLIVPCDNGLVAVKVNLGSNPPFTVAWRGPNYFAGPPIIAGNAVWDVDTGNEVIYALSITNGQTLFHDTIGSVPTHFNSVSAGDGQIFVSASSQVLAYFPAGTPVLSAVRGTDNGIYYGSSVGGSWTGWSGLPGATVGSPAGVQCGGKLYLAVQGTDNGIYFGSLNTATNAFSGWTSLPGATSSGPGLAADSSCNLYMAVRGTDNGIYLNSYTGGVWQGWTGLPGATSGSPGIAVYGGQLWVAVEGADHDIYVAQESLALTSFSGWSSIPGATSAGPRLTVDSANNVLYVAVRGTDNLIYINQNSGSGWSTWSPVPNGTTPGSPAIIVSNAQMYVEAQGTDNAIYFTTRPVGGSSWSSWSSVPGATSSGPALS